jgi:chorismate mutase/prephenate dehydratase
MKSDMQDLRNQIDDVTGQIVDLFQRRQELSEKIGSLKESDNLAITDTDREQYLIAKAQERAEEKYKIETSILTRDLIALSKLRQSTQLGLVTGTEFPQPIPIPAGAVAYQGVSGAWGEYTAGKLFPDRKKVECDYFDDVFKKIKNGEAACGVAPIENSHTGAIGEVYDLLRRGSCYIVGQSWINVHQCLMGVKGASINDIREVLSHREGLSQCSRYLKKHPWDLTDSRNTAVAAQTVASRGEKRFAAIGSEYAAQVYGLDVLAENISDDPHNRTRFIAIAAQPWYDAASDVVSVTFSTRHVSGALAAVLEPIGLYNINLTRIESRPVSQNSYRFFADIEGNISNPDIVNALSQASQQAEYFEVLGCYGSGGDKA